MFLGAIATYIAAWGHFASFADPAFGSSTWRNEAEETSTTGLQYYHSDTGAHFHPRLTLRTNVLLSWHYAAPSSVGVAGFSKTTSGASVVPYFRKEEAKLATFPTRNQGHGKLVVRSRGRTQHSNVKGDFSSNSLRELKMLTPFNSGVVADDGEVARRWTSA